MEWDGLEVEAATIETHSGRVVIVVGGAEVEDLTGANYLGLLAGDSFGGDGTH
jgi:hypothetical protein